MKHHIQLGVTARGVLATVIQALGCADEAPASQIGDAEYLELMTIVAAAARQRAATRRETMRGDDDELMEAAGIPTTPWPLPATQAALKAVSLDLAAEA